MTMNFEDYLNDGGRSNAQAGRDLKISGEAVRLLKSGERHPKWETMKKIYNWSYGMVEPNDWFGEMVNGKPRNTSSAP